MKKTYTKPHLAVESFQLDAAVATSCSAQGKAVLSQDVNGCSFESIDRRITQFGGKCITDVVNVNNPKYGLYNYLCYHGPVVEYTSIFITS